ncbi:protein of unknown function (plasmid) [Pararobbsia alpina]
MDFGVFGGFMFGQPRFRRPKFLCVRDRADQGFYKARAARVFRFDEIGEARRLMESVSANGKIVVRLAIAYH